MELIASYVAGLSGTPPGVDRSSDAPRSATERGYTKARHLRRAFVPSRPLRTYHNKMDDLVGIRASPRALNRLLKQVHRINRKQSRASAKAFEGAM
jgi:hypothetical protein